MNIDTISGQPGEGGNSADAPDEFDLVMDQLASGADTPPADAAGQGAGDPGEAGEGSDTPPGSDQEAGVSQPAAGAAPPAGDQSTDDIWAKAPPELRSAYEASLRDANYRYEAVKGRLSASDRELARLRNELNRQPETPANAEPEGQRPALNDPFDEAKIKQLREDYGEVAGPLVDMIATLKGELDQIKAPVNQLGQERQAALLDQQEQFLGTKHSDWKTVVADERFAGWAEQQPQWIKEALSRNASAIVDGQEAARVLDLYKMDIGAGISPPPALAEQNNSRLSDKRQRQLDAGRDAASHGGQAATGGVPDDFDAAMDVYTARAASARQR